MVLTPNLHVRINKGIPYTIVHVFWKNEISNCRWSASKSKLLNIFLFVSFQVVDKLIGNDPDAEDYRPNYPMKIQLYELCLLALLIPFVFIKNIKHLAPFSMLANIASLAGLGFICEYMYCRKAPIWSRAAYVWARLVFVWSKRFIG